MRLRNKPWAKDFISNNKQYAISEPEKYKGLWNKVVFNNSNPINIEIGSGKGEFIVTLANKNPVQNYIAIERYPTVLVIALKKIIDKELPNLKVISFDAINLTSIFDNEEISKIYLNFSDPWPKIRHAKRRLTSERFIDLYSQILRPTGEIHFKTDNDELFAFSLSEFNINNWKIIFQTTDLYNSSYFIDNIPTEYERRFRMLNKTINYAYFKK